MHLVEFVDKKSSMQMVGQNTVTWDGIRLVHLSL